MYQVKDNMGGVVTLLEWIIQNKDTESVSWSSVYLSLNLNIASKLTSTLTQFAFVSEHVWIQRQDGWCNHTFGMDW